MNVELTVVGIRNYCGGEEGYPQLFARLPIGCEVYLRINPPGEPYPGSVSVYDMEGQQIGSISKTDRRYIEDDVRAVGVLSAKVTEHCAKDNCIIIEAENEKGIKEPYLRDITPEDDELVFDTTAQDARMVLLTDMVKSQLERFVDQDITKGQLEALTKVLTEYSALCCASLDGESSFKRADILRFLKKLAKKYSGLQPIYDDVFEQSKDLGRKNNDVKVAVYRAQYNNIYASATAKGRNGKSQVDKWFDTLRFAYSGELSEEDIKNEVKPLAEKLRVELMNKYVSCIDSDEDFSTALYSLNYRLRAIYVLYTRRIKYKYLMNLLGENDADAENTKMPEKHGKTNALPLPDSINSDRALMYFQKAIDRGLIKHENGSFSWIPIGNRGGNTQLAYFCGLVFEYKHTENGNAGTSFPEDDLNKLFGVKRMYSSLTQAHNAKKIQPWRRKIDELFE